MTDIDPGSFVAIVAAAALASLLVGLLEPRLVLPVVVVELLLGVAIGPQGLGLARVDDFTEFFANLGLGLLFYTAGFEIDFQRIRGRPLQLGLIGWGLSLALAYGLAGVLSEAGLVLSFLYTGSAMATTAIGTLIPILRDAGQLRTRFGTMLLGAGTVGEFGPILLVTLVLSTTHPAHEAAILAAFIALSVLLAMMAAQSMPRGWALLERTLESSSQLAVRLAVVLIFGLVALASDLGLDVVIGGFLAGMITRAALKGRELTLFEEKITAIGYGFLIPFFFLTSGIRLDLDALASGAALLKVPLLLAIFLVVRGLPAVLLYRRELEGRDRAALALFSATQLPLVVAITTIAVEEGHMRTSTSAALVGAAMLSTLIFPLIALRLREGAAS